MLFPYGVPSFKNMYCLTFWLFSKTDLKVFCNSFSRSNEVLFIFFTVSKCYYIANYSRESFFKKVFYTALANNSFSISEYISWQSNVWQSKYRKMPSVPILRQSHKLIMINYFIVLFAFVNIEDAECIFIGNMVDVISSRRSQK